MSVGPLAVEILVAGLVSAFFLHQYGNWRKQHLLTTIAAFISWYFSFLIIVILPLDVSSTCYRQCLSDAMHKSSSIASSITPSPNSTASPVSIPDPNLLTTSLANVSNLYTVTEKSMSDHDIAAFKCQPPWTYVPDYILPTLWRVIYWTSQAMTWLILPVMQSYATAGEFTVAGKIKSSLIANAIYYGTYLLIFGVCLIYVAIRPDLHFNFSQLKVLAITASNTWGLFLLVLLLGYGLVDLPRSLWDASRRGVVLQKTYFKAAKLSTEKSEAEENLEDILDDVKKAADTIKYNHPLRKCVDTILQKCPESVQNSVQRNMDDYEDYNNPTETPTEKSLIRLHKSVIKRSQHYRRTQCQWSTLLEEAFQLEDIALNEVSSQRQFVRSVGKYEGCLNQLYNSAVEWYWWCWIRPWLLRVGAVLMAIFSIMLVWSECLFFVQQPTLSLFALFVERAADNYNYFYIEFSSWLTITYLAVSAYYVVFKIRVFNYYYLASSHQTDENSLLFAGMMLCRLTPPLCLNFLGLVHLDSHVTKQYNLQQTSYTQIMGHMDVISFIANGFNIYFPILVLLLCVCTYFRLGSRLLHCLGFQQFIGDDELTQELSDEGRELVKRERRKRQRAEDSEVRKKNWTDRFGESTSYGSQHDNKSGGSGRKRASALYAAKVKQSDNRDSDRIELLQQGEAIDYSPDTADPFGDDSPEKPSNEPWRSSGGAQYHSSVNASNFPSSAHPLRSSVPPPKSIFDDV